MILLDKAKLKFLLAGRAIDVDVPRAYDKRRIYSVGVRPKHAVCRAQILNATETADGWTLTIRQHTEDVPVFLAANPGAIRADYTTNPARAAREANGSPIEAVRDDAWIAKVAAAASSRDDRLRRERAHAARLESRSKNTSGSRVKWSVAPPASDIQAVVSAGRSFASPKGAA